MATLHWKGKAPATAQVVTATPGGTIGTATFTLTVGGVSVGYTAEGGDTADDVAEGLRAAWAASAHPYFAAVSAAADAGVLTLTAAVPGVPFIVTSAATGSATLTLATVTAGAGANDWNTPANWSGGVVPDDGDVVVIEHGDVPICWGLDQSGVALAELRVLQTYTGRIGLRDDQFALGDDAADAAVPEYRPANLRIGAAVIRIGEHHGPGAPAGSTRIRLDTGDTATQLNVANTADAGDGSLEPVRWIGTHEDNVVNVTRGRVGIATSAPAEEATVSALNISHRGNVGGDAHVNVGSAVTLGDVSQTGGELTLGCAAATISQSAGTLTTHGSGAVADATIGGIAHLNAVGTIAGLVVTAAGQADFSGDPRPRTVSQCQLHKGATLNIDTGSSAGVTFTNGIDLIRCAPGHVTLIAPQHVNVALTALE